MLIFGAACTGVKILNGEFPITLRMVSVAVVLGMKAVDDFSEQTCTPAFCVGVNAQHPCLI